MSDRPTPETDALDRELHNPRVLQDRYSEMMGLAQNMERERDEARAERDAWRNHAERFAAILSDETPLATIGTDVLEALEEFRSLKEEYK